MCRDQDWRLATFDIDRVRRIVVGKHELLPYSSLWAVPSGFIWNRDWIAI